MAHEWGQEIWRHEDQVDVWRKMAGWLIDNPSALTNVQSEPHRMYPGCGVVEGAWQFHTLEPDNQGVQRSYILTGVGTLNTHDRGPQKDLYDAVQVLNQPEAEAAHPRAVMTHGLLGVPRPGIIFNRGLPVDDLHQAAAIALAGQVQTIKMRVDRQFGNFCAGEGEVILGINDPSQFSNYDYMMEVPGWLGVMSDLIAMSKRQRLAPGAPARWHEEHKAYGY